jgi:hypothetical protein
MIPFLDPEWLALALQFAPPVPYRRSCALFAGYEHEETGSPPVRHVQHWANGQLVGWRRVDDFPAWCDVVIHRPIQCEYEMFFGIGSASEALARTRVSLGDVLAPQSVIPFMDAVGADFSAPGSSLILDIRLDDQVFGGSILRYEIFHGHLMSVEVGDDSTPRVVGGSCRLSMPTSLALQYLRGRLPLSAVQPPPPIEGDLWMLTVATGIFDAGRARALASVDFTPVKGFVQLMQNLEVQNFPLWRSVLREATRCPN